GERERQPLVVAGAARDGHRLVEHLQRAIELARVGVERGEVVERGGFAVLVAGLVRDVERSPPRLLGGGVAAAALLGVAHHVERRRLAPRVLGGGEDAAALLGGGERAVGLPELEQRPGLIAARASQLDGRVDGARVGGGALGGGELGLVVGERLGG